MSASPMVAYAETELRRAGMYDTDADYGGGAIAEEVMKIVRAVSSGGHSGGSFAMTWGIADRLVHYRPLSPLTSNPDEWMDITDISGGSRLAQSRRAPTCFSTDGGKTYYDLDEKERPIHETADVR